MSRMPRELDPEWFWRARLWAASWKAPLLVGLGIIWGAVFMLVQLHYPSWQGPFMAMGWTAIMLLAVYAVLRWLP